MTDNRDEFDALLAEILGGYADEVSRERFNLLLREHPEWVELYFAQMRVHLLAERKWSKEEAGGGRDAAARLKQETRCGWQAWRGWWKAAAAVAIAAVTVWVATSIRQGEELGGRALGAVPAPVALVRESGTAGLVLPQTLPGTLRLAKGQATVRLASGVELTVLGPSVVEVKDAMGGCLQEGRLLAHVPAVAAGFTVRTPELEVWDIGTVFGVSAEVGHSEVFVFKGSVQVNEASGDGVGLCNTGEGVRAVAGEPPLKFAADWNEAQRLFAPVRGMAAVASPAAALATARKVADLWAARYLPKPFVPGKGLDSDQRPSYMAWMEDENDRVVCEGRPSLLERRESAMKTNTVVAVAAAVVGMTAGTLGQTPVLRYDGPSGGDWFAAGVWRDESGTAVNWQDGAIVVMTNVNVTLTANAEVYGFQVHLTDRRYIYGTGRLTLGAGGIYKTGVGEFNLQNGGGLHLAESQAWTCPNGAMVCLDGLKPFTAAEGVVLTGDGATVMRNNSAGTLTAQNTVYVRAPATLSLSSGGSLGGPVLVLDGSGTRMSGEIAVISPTRVCSHLILWNGASFDASGRTFDVPVLEVETPTNGVFSGVTGANAMMLARAETELRVAADAGLQVSVPLANASGVTAALRKTGTGTLVLGGAGTFTGGVAVDAGWVRLSHASGAGTGTVALDGAAVLEITAVGTVANAVAGDGRVVKSGSGTVTLAGANTYTGGTSLSGGVTRVSGPAGLGGGGIALSPGASLVFTASQTVLGTDVARVTGTGTVLAGAGAEVVWGGDYAVAGGLVLDAEAGGTMAVGQLTGSGFTKSGAGKLRIAGTTGYSGEIVVSAGVLEIGSTALLAEGVTVRTAGSGAVQLDTFEGEDLEKITGTRVMALADGAALVIDTDTQAVMPTVATNETLHVTALTGAAELVKTGPGTMVVSNAAAFTGRVRVLEGRLLAADAMGGNAVVVSNGVFCATGGAVLQNTYTVAGGTLLADAGGSLGGGSVTLLTGGTVAATNAGSLGSGTLAVSAGTLRMDAGGTAGTRAVTLSSPGRIEVYDGAGFDEASVTLGGGTLDFRATTTMGCGLTLTANTTCSATTPAGAASPTVATVAGAVNAPAGKKLSVSGNGKLRLAGGGTLGGGGEIFVVSGGDLTVVSNKVTVTGYAGLESSGYRFAVADGGTLEMTGSGKRLHAGHGSGNALFEVATGGVFIAKSGVEVRIALNGGDATFRLSGGEAVAEGSGVFMMGDASTSSDGRVELNAGVLRTSRQIVIGTGTGVVAFNGGVLQSDGVNSYTPWIATGIPVTVGAAGGVIDALGRDMVLGSSGISGAGALRQAGGGSVRFTQTSTNWSGGLVVERGTAVAAATNALGTGTMALGTNTLLFGASVPLSGLLAVPPEGGRVVAEAGVTGAVATVSGGLLVKAGEGVLLADYVQDGTDFSIRGGQVVVTPLEGLQHVPAAVPALWMDASVASSFVTAVSNDVSRWYDRRTPGDTSGFFATNLYNRPMLVSGALNGLPVLDFGRLGQTGQANENRMMVFRQAQTNIRTVFWVVGSRNGGGFLLGDSQAAGSARHFHRGSQSGTYGGVASDALWHSTSDKGIVRAGETWTNGVVVNGTSAGLSGGYDLVTWRLSATDDTANNTPFAVWFASCYADPGGRLNGGQELAEVLVYTNRLSDAERKATEVYLSRKWFPARAGAGLFLGTVSLDGAGAGFVNAYPATVRIDELVVNATGVFVDGAAGGTIADRVRVTAQGVLSAQALSGLSIGDLTFEEQATLGVLIDTVGTVAAFHVAGDLALPVSARFVVALQGSVKPHATLVLVTAGGSVQMPGGGTAWVNAGTVSGASTVFVDADGKRVLLKTPRGTQIMVR